MKKKQLTKTKIDWCDYVWNPVWGCLNNCKYCYARKIARRFAKRITGKEFKNSEWKGVLHKEEFEKLIKAFAPTWIKTNFFKPLPKKPSKIFVNSMSEIYYWQDEWWRAVLRKIKQYPQHIFLFLTKFPEIYGKWNFPQNCWLGVTVTNPDFGSYRVWELISVSTNTIRFISFEPLLGMVEKIPPEIDWVIVGAQTNPYKSPERKWIEVLIEECKERNIPLFLKDNIYRAYPDLPEMKQFPNIKNDKGGVQSSLSATVKKGGT